MNEQTSFDSWLDGLSFKDPKMFQLFNRHGKIECAKRHASFASLCEIIISQQLSVAAAQAIFNRLVALSFDGELTSTAILEIEINDLKEIGISSQKANFLRNNALIFEGRPNFMRDLAWLSDLKLELELVKLPGVGPWTAQIFMMSCFCRQDMFPEGDGTLNKMISKLYGFSPHEEPQRLNEISEIWKPFRSYVARVLWREADSKPI